MNLHDAKHVLSFATLRKCRDPSDPSRSLIIFYLYVRQCHSLNNLHSLQKVIHRRSREATRRPIPRTRIINASKPVARPFNLPNHSEQRMAVCGLSLHQGSGTESRKTLEPKYIFEIALLILTVSTNAFHTANLFCSFLPYLAPTNSVAPSFCI